MKPELEDWHPRYHVTAPIGWHGRRDGPGATRIHEVIKVVDLRQPLLLEGTHRLGLLGFACDQGIQRNQGRIGAASGPQTLRQCLGPLAYHLPPEAMLYDLGDILCQDHDLEASQRALATLVALASEQNIHPLVIGGGHEAAWGVHQGLMAAHPGKKIGILNFDAHFDLRHTLESDLGTSGSSFLQIANAHHNAHLPFDYVVIGIQPYSNTLALFETARQLNAEYITAQNLHENGTQAALTLIDRLVDKCDLLHISICLDVIAATYAPAVSSPQPLGLLPWQIDAMLRHALSSGKTAGLEIAELSPGYDKDNRTAVMVATLVASAIHTWLRR